MHVFFWCWIFFISAFCPALPLQMPGTAVKVNLLSCPMQYRPVFCSLLSSLLLCMYLETIFRVDVFRASEISLPASSQHQWNCIVKKNRFFIGDCIRIGALHRIISIASNCSSSSGFALRSVPAPQRALSCVLWAGLCWNELGPCEADVAPRSERLSPVHWLLGGHCQNFTLSVKPALK